MAGNFQEAVKFLHRHRGLVLPVAAASLIFAVLVPIPPALMNVLLVGNIALAAVILLTTIHVASPLEFSVFPSLLLGATLVRLVLNVATTRLILTAGADGRGMQEAQFAAGRVIWAFSTFVTAGSLEVGVILFVIIATIQFVVITRGAARISEVAARFVLDAMPGKQMAIDADLNAGLIDEAEAHRRRQKIAGEADFYGAMDGASKFLRGDAIAAVMITMVNILGGLYIGLVQYGWSFAQTLSLFTRLTIGDGLVTQIPAFIVAISAALLVTRSTAKSNLAEEIIAQLTGRPVALIITAGFLIALTLTSLPKVPLLMLAAGCGGLAWLLSRKSHVSAGGTAGEGGSAARKSAIARQVEPDLTVDPLRIEVGYGLVHLVDPDQGGDLLDRVADLRQQIGSQLGLLVPGVKIKDNMALEAEAYVIKVRGAKAAAGKLRARNLLAIKGLQANGELAGIETAEPATGIPAVWISPSQRDRAEMLDHTVLTPSAVLAGHLDLTIRRHAAELLTRQQVVRLLDRAGAEAGDLVREVKEALPLGRIQKVLQNLLQEGVAIRDLERILEALCDAAGQTDDASELTELVRRSLGRALSQQYCSEDGKLWCVSLAPSLAEQISRHNGEGLDVAEPSPAWSRRISEALASGLARLTRHGRRPVLLCDPQVRVLLRRIVAPVMPEVAVLAYNEVDSADVQSVGSVGIE